MIFKTVIKTLTKISVIQGGQPQGHVTLMTYFLKLLKIKSAYTTPK